MIYFLLLVPDAPKGIAMLVVFCIAASTMLIYIFRNKICQKNSRARVRCPTHTHVRARISIARMSDSIRQSCNQ